MIRTWIFIHIILIFGINMTIYAQCPTIDVLMVDACGTEQDNEFLIINSGNGFNTSSLQLNYDANNNTFGPENNDIHINVDNFPADPTPCSLLPGNASLVTGCTNVISIGLNYEIPPNSTVIIFTSALASYGYNFSSLCGTGGCVYVIRSSCNRSIGAFSNAAAGGLRETIISIEGTACSHSVIYDRALLNGTNGDYYGPGIGYGNIGCVVPPIPAVDPSPVFNELVDQEVCGEFTFPIITGTNLSGNELYFTGPDGTGLSYEAGETTSASGTYYIHDPSNECTDDETFELTILAQPPTFPAGPLEACADENGDAIFNLSSLDNIITGGSGEPVTWFLNPELTTQSSNPSAQLILEAAPVPFAYAVINHNTACASDPEPVELIVNTPITFTNPFVDGFCESAEPVLLPMELTGVPGTWSGDGVSGGTFNPSGLVPSAFITFTPAPDECASETTFEIIITAGPTITVSSNSPVCEGTTIELSASGGNSYQWSGPSGFTSSEANPSVPDAATVNEGTYSVTVTDGNGCTTTASVDVTMLDSNINPFATAIPNSACVGDEVDFFVLPDGMTYNWQGPVQSSDQQGWSIPEISFDDAGSYSVTVTDANGCTGVGSVNVSVGEPPEIIATSNSPLCVGNELMLSASGGVVTIWTYPDGFSTNNPNPVISNVTMDDAGTYTLIVTSDSGCSATTTVEVVISPGLNITTSNEQDVSCPGENDGAFTLNVEGVPAPPYNFEWEAPPGFNPNLGLNQNLASGVYGITVTDGNGCVGSASLVISAPDDFDLSCVKLNDESSTGAEDGRINVNLNGSDHTFDLSINPPVHPGYSNVVSGEFDFDNLPAGTYTITATDDNGCTKTCIRTINSGDCPDIFISLGPESILSLNCAGDANGAIFVTVNGGQEPYLFDWLPNVSTGPSAENLSPGNYSIYITDSNGCENSLEAIPVTAPDPINLFCGMQNPASSETSEDGIALIDLSGGIPNYTIFSVEGPTLIDLPSVAPGSFEIEDLLPGNYTIVINDANGCEQSCSFNIAFGDCEIVASIDILQDVSCHNGDDGALEVNVFDNTGNVTYSWNPSTVPDTGLPTGLSPGMYFVTVEDASGCTAEASVELLNPFPLEVLCASQPVTEPGESDGSITINIAGISSEFTIEWAGPESGTETIQDEISFTIENLPAGVYDITVTDENGCTATCTPTVLGSECNVTSTFTSLTCNDSNDGSIDVQVSGATGNINYNWTGPELIDSDESNPTGLPSGDYSVTITDEGSCMEEINFTLINPTALTLICNPVNASPGNDDGEIFVNINGGTPDYNISYTGPESGSLDVTSPGVFPISSLPIGEYTIVVTDENDCTNSCTATIEELSCSVSGSATNPTCHNTNDGSILIQVANTMGEVTYTWTADDPIEPDISNPGGLSAGDYSVLVTDEENCSVALNFTLINPDELTFSCTANAATTGNDDGEIIVTINGGTAGYTITYSGPVSGSVDVTDAGNTSLSGLAPGNYDIIVVDTNGCTADTCMAEIIESGCEFEITCNVTSNETSQGASDGAIEIFLSPTDQIITITYQLPDLTDVVIGPIDVSGSVNVQDLPPGLYELRVTNDEGCQDLCTFTILPASSGCNMTLTLGLLEAIQCHGDDNAIFRFDIEGEFQEPLNIVMQPGNITLDPDVNVVDNLPAGIYSVLVTDDAGCTAESSIEIVQPDPLFLSCSVVSDGEVVRLSWAGGTGVINYTLTDESGTEIVSTSPITGSFVDIEDLEPGIYTAILTDENGCTSNSCQFSITTEECNMTILLTIINTILCAGDATAHLEVSINNGDSPYTYEWNDASLGNTANPDNLTAGQYAVTVMDANNCLAVSSIQIDEPTPLLLANCVQLAPASGENIHDGRARLNLQGGTPGYVLFRTGPNSNAEVPISEEGTSTILGLEAGLHEFILVDMNGCETNCSVLIGQQDSGACDLEVNLVSITNNPCIADSKGAVSISIEGAVGNVTINWDSGQTSSTISSLRNGTYVVTVTDEDDCMVVDTFVVTSPPGMTSSWSVLEASCLDPEPNANLIRVDGGVAPYKIVIFGDTLPGVPGRLDYEFEHNMTFPAKIIDSNGCNVTINLVFGSSKALELSAIPSFTIEPGESVVQVLNLNQPVNTVNIDIDYNGMNICMDCSQFSFIPTASGSGLITATQGECMTTFEFVVIINIDEIELLYPVYVPNAFTPNLDGINDRFEPYFDGTVINVQFFRVFDRWGNLMHEVLNVPPDSPQLGWNGRYKGQNIDPGTYVYSLSVEFADGTVRHLAGEVVLYR